MSRRSVLSALVVASLAVASLALAGCKDSPAISTVRHEMERTIPGAEFEPEFHPRLGGAALGLAKTVAKWGLEVDSEERAAKSTAQWGIQNLRVGYDLDESTAESWGLFRSSAAMPEEPEIFFEPALFLVRPDGSLYGSSVNSMPFARASLGDLQQALTMIIKNQFPARGVATRP